MKVGDTKRRANKMRARNTNSKRLRSNVSHSKVKLLCLLKWPQTEVRKGKAKKEKKRRKKRAERTRKGLQKWNPRSLLRFLRVQVPAPFLFSVINIIHIYTRDCKYMPNSLLPTIINICSILYVLTRLTSLQALPWLLQS